MTKCFLYKDKLLPFSFKWLNPGLLALPGLALTILGAQAQSLEPRAYSNLPVDLNIVVMGSNLSQGKLAFDPSTSIVDAKFDTETGILAYVRTLDAFGKSAKFDAVLPFSSFSGSGKQAGLPKQRNMSGFNDPRFRFSLNFYGAPALSTKEYAEYRQDLIIGASLQVTMPLGQYDHKKLINLGGNRWSFKPELGISQAWGPWTLEVAPSVTFYTENADFNGGNKFSQAPLIAMEAHLVYLFSPGMWLSLDGNYYTGNRTALNEIAADNRLINTRAGMTFAVPISPSDTLKLHASGSLSTRTGDYFNLAGFAWQHRW